MANRRVNRDPLFFSSTAVVMALTAFGGFAATYYLRFLDGGPVATLTGGPMTALVHVHAVLFTGWVLLFVAQTAAIATRRTRVHRLLGTAGALLAVAMVVAGASLAITSAAHGQAPPGGDPLAFLLIPLTDVTLFAVFFTLAFLQRHHPEKHKRLMLFSYVSIITAAVARLPGVLPLGPPAFFGLTYLFVVAVFIYDYLTQQRIFPVTLWGGALILVSYPARLLISGTETWRSIAATLVG